MPPFKLAIVRIMGTLVVATGTVYVLWRWTDTLNWSALWLAIPLVLAETYSLGESILYAFNMWNAKARPPHPSARPGLTVDVFITTYNEPLELVLKTALAAKAISYPHKTWILDDGQRPEFAMAAESIEVGYVTRGSEWDGKPRFAKAGNINNALFQTDGEFIAILDADQVPQADFLDDVLGYFEDDTVAFVQTPQEFWNLGRKDPLGSRAELFYGPIQQGKDGWDAAFFCGSNAVLRREALMALGLSTYSGRTLSDMRHALKRAKQDMQQIRAQHKQDKLTVEVADEAIAAIGEAAAMVRRGAVLTDVTSRLTTRLTEARDRSAEPSGTDPQRSRLPEEMAAALSAMESHFTHLGEDQVLAINPMSTSSITEDMATALHLHALGWSSVYHHRVLVRGLAPEDLKTMLSQRKRWATGTMQVFFTQNPLFMHGLSWGQRLMYLATMTSYLNGFAAVVFLISPIIYLTTGIFPLNANATTFFAHFLPFFILCQLFFQISGHGCRGMWKGQQMSIALFPTWIMATLEGLAAAVTGRRVAFSVTSKTKPSQSASAFRHVVPQLVAIGLLLVASGIGVARVALGAAGLGSTLVSLAWVAIDLALLWAVVPAALYRGPKDSDITSPSTSEDELLAALIASAVTGESTLQRQLEDLRISPSLPIDSDAPIDHAVYALNSRTLDGRAALALRNGIAKDLTYHRKTVLVDVSKVTRVTPAGIASVVQITHMVRAKGSDFRIFGVSEAIFTAHTAYHIDALERLYDEDDAEQTGEGIKTATRQLG